MSVEPQTDDAAPVALTRAADVAGYAPSLENTQPWRWRVEGDSMWLYAEPIRQLTASDPGGRLMVFSCGAALHHARIALAAQGWRINVDRLTEPDRPQLLARVRIVGRTEETQVARRLLRAVHMRQTDPRRVRPIAVERKDIDTIRSAVEAERTSLRILNADAVMELAAAVAAHPRLPSDPQGPPKITQWAATHRTDWLGDPHRSVAPEPPPTASAVGARSVDEWVPCRSRCRRVGAAHPSCPVGGGSGTSSARSPYPLPQVQSLVIRAAGADGRNVLHSGLDDAGCGDIGSALDLVDPHYVIAMARLRSRPVQADR